MSTTLQFGSMSPLSPAKVRYLIVHTQGCPRNGDGSAAAIHSYHRKPKQQGGRGWSGIGYHFVIRKNGKVEEGRPLNRAGAHVSGLNSESVGICCSGNGDVADFTAAQKASLTKLLRELQQKFPGTTVEGHRPLLDRLIDAGGMARSYRTTKTCPGKKVSLDEIRKLVGGASSAPRPSAAPATGQPLPGEARWSNHLGERIILTRFDSDEKWYYVKESELKERGTRAGARWSAMPPDRP